MNKELIESITKLVIEKLDEVNGQAAPEVNLRGAEKGGTLVIEKTLKKGSESLITFKPLQATEREKPSMKRDDVPQKNVNTNSVQSSDDGMTKKDQQLEELRKKTPSRIAVGRTGSGSRPKTDTWLKFRFDHAAAVDAVYGEVPSQILDELGVFSVESRVKDKEEYIRRPDLGRRLSDEARQTIQERCEKSPAVQIVISNGLSASAVETNINDVYLSLQQSLNRLNIKMGTTFYVDKGRVALMDEIGDVLTPDVVIMLIGERPGLVSAESLSAYLCYRPRKGVIEADRMVVSNIHRRGIPPVEAGAYLGTVVQRILLHEASGVKLVEKEG